MLLLRRACVTFVKVPCIGRVCSTMLPTTAGGPSSSLGPQPSALSRSANTYGMAWLAWNGVVCHSFPDDGRHYCCSSSVVLPL